MDLLQTYVNENYSNENKYKSPIINVKVKLRVNLLTKMLP